MDRRVTYEMQGHPPVDVRPRFEHVSSNIRLPSQRFLWRFLRVGRPDAIDQSVSLLLLEPQADRTLDSGRRDGECVQVSFDAVGIERSHKRQATFSSEAEDVASNLDVETVL
jgi:hypothetical protein